MVDFRLCWVSFALCGLSLVAASGGSSLVLVHGLLLVADFSCRSAQAVGAQASVVAEQGLSS